MILVIVNVVLAFFVTESSALTGELKCSMDETVKVSIEKICTDFANNFNSIVFKVENNRSSTIWLVDDDWFVWKQEGSIIELSFQRTKMIPGASVFGYFEPDLKAIDPGKSITKKVALAWPLKLNTIWNKDGAANPSPGRYSIHIRLGYGLSEEIENGGANMEEQIFNWQKIVTSNTVDLIIPEGSGG